MNRVSKITKDEYQQSVERARKNPQNYNPKTVKSPYIMIKGIPHKNKNGNWIPLTKIN
jgi:hypothetical protein